MKSFLSFALICAAWVAVVFHVGCALDTLNPCNAIPSRPSSWVSNRTGERFLYGNVISVATVGSNPEGTCIQAGVQIVDDLYGEVDCDMFLNGNSSCLGDQPVCAGVMHLAATGQTIDNVCVYF